MRKTYFTRSYIPLKNIEFIAVGSMPFIFLLINSSAEIVIVLTVILIFLFISFHDHILYELGLSFLVSKKIMFSFF